MAAFTTSSPRWAQKTWSERRRNHRGSGRDCLVRPYGIASNARNLHARAATLLRDRRARRTAPGPAARCDEAIDGGLEIYSGPRIGPLRRLLSGKTNSSDPFINAAPASGPTLTFASLAGQRRGRGRDRRSTRMATAIFRRDVDDDPCSHPESLNCFARLGNRLKEADP